MKEVKMGRVAPKAMKADEVGCIPIRGGLKEAGGCAIHIITQHKVC